MNPELMMKQHISFFSLFLAYKGNMNPEPIMKHNTFHPDFFQGIMNAELNETTDFILNSSKGT